MARSLTEKTEDIAYALGITAGRVRTAVRWGRVQRPRHQRAEAQCRYPRRTACPATAQVDVLLTKGSAAERREYLRFLQGLLSEIKTIRTRISRSANQLRVAGKKNDDPSLGMLYNSRAVDWKAMYDKADSDVTMLEVSIRAVKASLSGGGTATGTVT